MNMKFKFLPVFLLLLSFNKSEAKNINLNKEFLPLKDFLIFKLDFFMKENIQNIFSGGGLISVAYQNLDYQIKFSEGDILIINIQAYMDKQRYTSKRYYPKLRDCNQVRNKIFLNKYGYSFLTQKFNNLVNEESLTNSLKDKVFNISSFNDALRQELIKKTRVNVKIIHPRSEKNITCGGKIIDTELSIE